MLIAAATASNPAPSWVLFLAAVGVGTLFAVLGLVLATDWRGYTTRHVQVTLKFFACMPRLRNRDGDFRRQYRLERYVIGPTFAVAGGLTLVVVLVESARQLLH